MTGLIFESQNIDKNVLKKLKFLEKRLSEWNSNSNLTSKKDSGKIWNRHILDSLQLLPLLGDINKLADMGSGIGIPSIPLAITCPNVNVFAIESNKKKMALASQLVRELAIPNIHFFPEKVEKVYISHMDVVCCRAFGEYLRDASLAYKMLKPGGLFMTFKASYEKRIAPGYENVTNHHYRLPSYPKDFSIVVAQKIGESD